MSQQAQPAPEPVWGGTIDDEKFTAVVCPEETGSHAGKLRVYVTATDETLIEKDVTISYGAPFGPDVADVMLWETNTMEAIDAWYAAHGETPPEST